MTYHNCSIPARFPSVFISSNDILSVSVPLHAEALWYIRWTDIASGSNARHIWLISQTTEPLRYQSRILSNIPSDCGRTTSPEQDQSIQTPRPWNAEATSLDTIPHTQKQCFSQEPPHRGASLQALKPLRFLRSLLAV